MAFAARVAICGSAAATPIKLPSRTTLAPGIASAALVSDEISVALKVAGRTTLPKSIPSRLTSEVYWCFPETRSRALTFATDVPAIVQSFGRGRDVVGNDLDQLSAPGDVRERERLGLVVIDE